jgi:hypothetical protein
MAKQKLEVGDSCQRDCDGELYDAGGHGNLSCDECNVVHSMWGGVVFHNIMTLGSPWADQYFETDPIKKAKYEDSDIGNRERGGLM